MYKEALAKGIEAGVAVGIGFTMLVIAANVFELFKYLWALY